MLITILSKEVFKVGMVLWCAIRGLSSPWLRPLCYGSAGLPLLLMRPTVLWEVLSFEPSRGEEGVEFILEHASVYSRSLLFDVGDGCRHI